MLQAIRRIFFCFIIISVISGIAAAKCNCPPKYCLDAAKAQQMKDAKKASLLKSGYPQRLVDMVDQLPDCPQCINTAPDGFQLRINYPDGSSKSLGWSKQGEMLAKDQLTSGKISSFSIVYTSKPCKCCPDEEYDGSLPGGGSGISTTFDNPKKLGTPPPDLTTPKPGSAAAPGTHSVPPPNVGERPQPPRIAQALCPACRGLAEQLNEIEQQIYETKLKIWNSQRTINVLENALQHDLDRINELASLASTEETQAQLAKAHKIYEAHRKDLEKERQKVEEYQKQLADLEAQLKDIEAKLLECERTACQRKPKVNVEPIPQPNPEEAKPPVKPKPTPSEPKQEAKYNGIIIGIHAGYETSQISGGIDIPPEQAENLEGGSSSNHTNSNSVVGLDLSVGIPNTPLFGFAETSWLSGNKNRIFNQKTDTFVSNNSTVSVKDSWQTLLAMGVNVIRLHQATFGLGVGVSFTQQKLYANVAEDTITRKTDSETLVSPSFIGQVSVPLCQSCLLHHPLLLQARLIGTKMPGQDLTIRSNNGFIYTARANPSWQYRGEIGLGVQV